MFHISKESLNNKCWGNLLEKEPPILVQSMQPGTTTYQENNVEFLKKLKVGATACSPANPTPGHIYHSIISENYMHECSLQHYFNIQNLESNLNVINEE